MVTEEVRFSDLLCRYQNCLSDLKILICLLAEQQTDGRWLVSDHYRKVLEIKDKHSHNRTHVGKDELSEKTKDCVAYCMFLIMVFLLCLAGYGLWTEFLRAQDNAELLRYSMELMANMNRTTLNNFFKEVVANETINAVDHPLAAEGLAHMFWFESNLKIQTTLEEYIDRMKPTQQSIFYAYDHSKSEIEQMSTVRSLVKTGNEVLFVTNSLDKRVIDRVDMFRGKWFVDVKRLISTKK
ncbi:hypothetical protein M3Y94_00485300 [Aphelenchoides besseyi]|nr:hypothetical protein M3Y94_00485300 [Aphelenchoides besseyi]